MRVRQLGLPASPLCPSSLVTFLEEIAGNIVAVCQRLVRDATPDDEAVPLKAGKKAEGDNRKITFWIGNTCDGDGEWKVAYDSQDICEGL